MKENNKNLINDEEEEEEKEIEPNPNNIEDISTRRLEQIEARQSNALLFKVPSKEDVIKVDKCSFIN